MLVAGRNRVGAGRKSLACMFKLFFKVGLRACWTSSN